MLAYDKDALICDLAETYHILDYKALPVELLAVLASGLREDSRIKKKISGSDVGPDRILLAGILDRLSVLVWMRTKDGTRGINYPISVLDHLLCHEDSNGITSFDSAEDFQQKWQEITRG